MMQFTDGILDDNALAQEIAIGPFLGIIQRGVFARLERNPYTMQGEIYLESAKGFIADHHSFGGEARQ